MQPVVIGIAGGSGSGKTTLARALQASCGRGVAMLTFDSYYRDQSGLAAAERRAVNYDHPDSLDIERFSEDLALLRSGAEVAVPVYDFATHTRSPDQKLVVTPEQLVIVDGILLLVFTEICDLLDVKVFIDVDDRIRTERRVRRDMAERGRTREMALSQIAATVRPMHREFVDPSAKMADVIIDGTADPDASAARVLHLVRAGAFA